MLLWHATCIAIAFECYGKFLAAVQPENMATISGELFLFFF